MFGKIIGFFVICAIVALIFPPLWGLLIAFFVFLFATPMGWACMAIVIVIMIADSFGGDADDDDDDE